MEDKDSIRIITDSLIIFYYRAILIYWENDCHFTHLTINIANQFFIEMLCNKYIKTEIFTLRVLFSLQTNQTIIYYAKHSLN